MNFSLPNFFGEQEEISEIDKYLDTKHCVEKRASWGLDIISTKDCHTRDSVVPSTSNSATIDPRKASRKCFAAKKRKTQSVA